MRFTKTKFMIFGFFLLFLLFFSNDFGVIDIEKMAIITAVGIDLDETTGDYQVALQVAVPEATDTNSENQKALIFGKGGTVGASIKEVANSTGWFPKLAFCNMIIIGNELAKTDVINVLDYFSKTLRIQDSAVVALAETTAREVLESSTPLDNISSFALQKVILKKPGFDNDVMQVDIKTFCAGYYSETQSSYMPIIKIEKQPDENQADNSVSGNGASSTGNTGTTAGGGNSAQNKNGNILYNARYTALFKKGKKVGELDPKLTKTYNILKSLSHESMYELNDVGAEGKNYDIAIGRNKGKLNLNTTDNKIDLDVNLSLYCEIRDVNGSDPKTTYMDNAPLKREVKEAMYNAIYKHLDDLVLTSIQTRCDFLGIRDMLYRYNHKYYGQYKDSYFDLLNYKINLTVDGEK